MQLVIHDLNDEEFAALDILYKYSTSFYMSFLSKLQPFFIILSAFTGILIGKFIPFMEQNAGKYIEFFLMFMLFFVFLNVNIREISKSFSDFRFSVSALLINFIFTPLFTFALSKLFLSGQTDLQTGFIMLMVTPCTDWYLVFTGVANGNVSLGASILPLNLVLQIILLPVYLLLFMGTEISFGISTIIHSILLVLIIPLVAANTVKIIVNRACSKTRLVLNQAPGKTGKSPVFPLNLRKLFQKLKFWNSLNRINMRKYFDMVLKKSDDIQFVLLCFAIISMFSSQGALLLDNTVLFIKLLPPLLLFFSVIFCVSLITGKLLGLPFKNTVPLIFTTSARNSPVSLAIAVITFPLRPVISLVLVMGPLIELPVLAINSVILKRIEPGSKPTGF